MSTLLDESGPLLAHDLYALRGRKIIEAFHEKLDRGTLPTLPPPIPSFPKGSVPPLSFPKGRVPPPSIPKDWLPPPFFPEDQRDFFLSQPVGILGAGVGGLYTALILDGLGIPYKILEAQGRVGGRLFTYEFPDQKGAPYNYVDIGAMRFPDIPAMRRTFHLFKYPPLNTGGIALGSKLRRYYYKGGGENNTLLSYNGVTVKQNAVPAGDPFKAKELILSVSNPDPYIKAGAQAIYNDALDPFVIRLLANSDDGWRYLEGYNMHSTRSYMSTVYLPSRKLQDLGVPNQHLPTDVINWCETFNGSTGGFDRSFVEAVLGAIAFGYVPGGSSNHRPTEWFCIDGGATQIAQCMEEYITRRQPGAIVTNSRVTSVSLSKDGESMDVVAGGHLHQFSHVISTIPLPVLRTLDLSGSELTSMQSNALRQLNYGRAIKIGLQFQTAWWTTGSDKDGRPLKIVGGQSYTDRLVRTIVYPSAGDVENGKTTTLTASYCRHEDAERLAALVENDKPGLIKIVLRDLAEIHNVSVGFLEEELIDSIAWNWTSDVNVMGAFAFFGPGKFENVYASLTNPAAKGRLHFAGEAISVRHAWVEGAFDSAWRAVAEMLFDPAIIRHTPDFFRNWGYNLEWMSGKAEPWTGKSHDSGKPFIPKPADSLVLQQLAHLNPEYFER